MQSAGRRARAVQRKLACNCSSKPVLQKLVLVSPRGDTIAAALLCCFSSGAPLLLGALAGRGGRGAGGGCAGVPSRRHIWPASPGQGADVGAVCEGRNVGHDAHAAGAGQSLHHCCVARDVMPAACQATCLPGTPAVELAKVSANRHNGTSSTDPSKQPVSPVCQSAPCRPQLSTHVGKLPQ